MFNCLNPRRFYFAIGRKKFLEFIILSIFLLFFYGPLLNMLMLAFQEKYEFPAVIPQVFGFKWWRFVLDQKNLVKSISTSFILAVITTFSSMLICLPAAYAIARYEFKGRRFFLFSFLLTNAFPKIGIYTSIGILFIKYGLMGTWPGVIIIHILNTMLYMVWLPSSSFRSVPRHQEEASRDIGAGPFRTFLKITLPTAMPGIAVASIYTFLGSLEEAQGTLLIGLPNIKTMPIEMYGVIMEYPLTAGAVFALILIIPSLVLLFALRKYIGPNAMAGGFKMK